MFGSERYGTSSTGIWMPIVSVLLLPVDEEDLPTPPPPVLPYLRLLLDLVRDLDREDDDDDDDDDDDER